jgi:manganese/iron transport system ATP-binding protein
MTSAVSSPAAPTVPVRLDVRDLRVRLGEHLALDGVRLSIDAGELVGLIGPNGAGKTTLIRAILGLVEIESGEIRIDGADVALRRVGLGYVPQRHEFAWEFPISVEQAVMTGRTHRIGWLRRPGPADREAVAHALERVAIADLRRRPIGALSGGQRQRVLIARALALDPRILLLDEPFTAVDVPTRDLLTGLLGELRTEGRAIVMSTHDVEDANRTCTRLALLNRTIIAKGAPAELRDPEIWLRTYGGRAAADHDAREGAA